MPSLEPDKVKEHWDDPATESLDDKYWAAAERRLISRYIPPMPLLRLLDAGCGEGEGTEHYAAVPSRLVTGIDYSFTRRHAARTRCGADVAIRSCDLRTQEVPGGPYDCIIATRLLINLDGWTEQSAALDRLIRALAPGGRLILLEGSIQGQDELNAIREQFRLPPITCRWFNKFLDDAVLEAHAFDSGLVLKHKTGLGAFFLLTRGIRQYFEQAGELRWDVAFNRIAASEEMEKLMPLGKRYSRLRLWVFDKAETA